MFDNNLPLKTAEKQAKNESKSRRVLFMVIVLIALLCLMPGLTFAEENHLGTETAEPRETAAPTLFISAEEIHNTAIEQGIIILESQGHAIPLISPAGFRAWALADLILVSLSLVALAIMGIRISIRRYKKGIYKNKKGALMQRNIYPPISIVAVIATVMSIVVFFLTQDIRQPPVLCDFWTAAFALLLIIVVAASTLAVKDEIHLEEELDDIPKIIG